MRRRLSGMAAVVLCGLLAAVPAAGARGSGVRAIRR